MKWHWAPLSSVIQDVTNLFTFYGTLIRAPTAIHTDKGWMIKNHFLLPADKTDLLKDIEPYDFHNHGITGGIGQKKKKSTTKNRIYCEPWDIMESAITEMKFHFQEKAECFLSDEKIPRGLLMHGATRTSLHSCLPPSQTIQACLSGCPSHWQSQGNSKRKRKIVLFCFFVFRKRIPII